MTEEYWFSSKVCLDLSCGGELIKQDRKDRRVLVCRKCGVINASIPKEPKK